MCGPDGHVIPASGVFKGLPYLVQMADAVPALFHVVGTLDEFAVCELDDCFKGP